MQNGLQNKVFHEATKAREWLENHLWPEGPVCGRCGSVNKATPIDGRPGLYLCNAKECRNQFTVTVGTVFERTHIPLNKWLMAAFLICASKTGMSIRQLHRMLGISYTSTWFMMHRLREAMRPAKYPGPLGGKDEIVEVDDCAKVSKKSYLMTDDSNYHHVSHEQSSQNLPKKLIELTAPETK
jgi:transposase-like protein